ncbi:DUF5654 family protein [Sphingomonas kaistensis]|uniref:DUF5654 family protein n=1 Tax=Sphingomonas kaistensis TaxID=298708 RepID=A0ABZ2G3Q2_9SPHN
MLCSRRDVDIHAPHADFGLASASLGLVAALEWNEVIKATLAYLGLGDSLAGLYTYAIIATVSAVAVLVWLGKLAARVGGDAAFSREAKG